MTSTRPASRDASRSAMVSSGTGTSATRASSSSRGGRSCQSTLPKIGLMSSMPGAKKKVKLDIFMIRSNNEMLHCRSGPGTKTVVRPKRRDEETENLKYKHVYRKKNLAAKRPVVAEAARSRVARMRTNSEGSSRSDSPSVPDPAPHPDNSLYPDFLDSTYWKR